MKKESERLFFQSIGNSIQENKDKIVKLEKQKLRLKNKNKKLQERIDNATERLNTLIEFWKKYNPIDNTMQVEQFKSVINILGGKE